MTDEQKKEEQSKQAPSEKVEEPKPTKTSKTEDRIKRQEDKHKAEIDAFQAKHDAEIARLTADHEEKDAKVKKALGVENGSEVDPAEKAKEATEQAKNALRLSAFRLAAAAAGMNAEAIDDAFNLIQSKDDLVVNMSTGEVTGVEGVVEKLIESKPYLKAPDEAPAKPAVGGGPANPQELSGDDVAELVLTNPSKAEPSAVRTHFTTICRKLAGLARSQRE